MTKQLTRHDLIGRIEDLQASIIRGREFLESGAHADWHGFRARFVIKKREGRDLPPHRDWVRNVFVPGCERALGKAEKLLERLELQSQKD